MIERAGFGSRLSVVAIHNQRVAVSALAIVVSQLTLRGSFAYWPRFEAGFELLVRRDLSRMVTHRYDIDEIGLALATLSGSKDCGKVLITIG
jgi:threonine dehydrogenase-like Zn-dependent dehydrogenase